MLPKFYFWPNLGSSIAVISVDHYRVSRHLADLSFVYTEIGSSDIKLGSRAATLTSQIVTNLLTNASPQGAGTLYTHLVVSFGSLGGLFLRRRGLCRGDHRRWRIGFCFLLFFLLLFLRVAQRARGRALFNRTGCILWGGGVAITLGLIGDLRSGRSSLSPGRLSLFLSLLFLLLVRALFNRTGCILWGGSVAITLGLIGDLWSGRSSLRLGRLSLFLSLLFLLLVPGRFIGVLNRARALTLSEGVIQK